ncbi:MAG: hypothetical protein EBX30_14120 [Betaproteobacteria bacterium]|nr:hypothetical protein [Betaproteobacteria bacterium]NCY08308.1 hypothetical protein [Betaproteobacteria bacterium]
MKCWICSRQARGFGHADERRIFSDSHRRSRDWVFCSRRCQDAFHALYGRCVRGHHGLLPDQEAAMIDPTPVEQGAMRACLRFFGEAAGEIGFEKPLGHYTEAEALTVIRAVVTAYTEAMVEHHEASVQPLRHAGSVSASENSQTLLEPAQSSRGPLQEGGVALSLADIKDDIPWESDSRVTGNKQRRGR